MKEEYQGMIDQYLLGQMPEEERLSFECEIKKDTELKEQLEFTEIVREAIVGRNRRLAQIKEWEEDYRWNRQDRDVLYYAPRKFWNDSLPQGGNGGGGGNCLSKGCILSIIALFILLIIGCVLLFN